jgi:hypothetical protein
VIAPVRRLFEQERAAELEALECGAAHALIAPMFAAQAAAQQEKGSVKIYAAHARRAIAHFCIYCPQRISKE